MLRCTLVFLLISSIAFGQRKHRILEATEPTVKRLRDFPNYIENSLRLLIIDHLLGQNIDTSQYFVDSSIHSSNDTLYIPLWHIEGLQQNSVYIKQLKEDMANNKGTLLLMTVNPGNCGTIVYESKKRKILGFYYWQ